MILVYITASGALVVDEANLTLGDSTVDPTLLITKISSRGKTTSNLYNFENNLPTGIVSLNNGEIKYITKIQKRIGIKIIFQMMGIQTKFVNIE